METRMSVVEGEEPIEGKLRAKVVILSTQHLLTHTGTDLRLEIQDGPEPKITALTTLVILVVLDTTPATESVHTVLDILF